MLTQLLVSIPSNGSIQFLHCMYYETALGEKFKSQSPQTGQFNSNAHKP